MDDRAASKSRKKDALTPSYCEHPGCDWPYKIQRHRIVPGRDGGKYKLGNVIGLCPNHHWMADNDLLGPEFLLEIVRIRVEASALEEANDEADSAGTDGTAQAGDRPSEASGESLGVGTPDAVHGDEPGLASS